MAPIDQPLYKEVKLSISIPILWECVHKTFAVSKLFPFPAFSLSDHGP